VQLPFPDCVPISRDFAGLTSKPGIYAIRHRSAGLLYVGKAQDVKERFRGGYKTITCSWLADYNHRDVAILFQRRYTNAFVKLAIRNLGLSDRELGVMQDRDIEFRLVGQLKISFIHIK
jgi:GIY-YIG catalytic domain